MSRHLDKCINKRVISHLRKQSKKLRWERDTSRSNSKVLRHSRKVSQASQRGARKLQDPGSQATFVVRLINIEERKKIL